MNICKTCKFYVDGRCDNVGFVDKLRATAPNDHSAIIGYTVADDHNLDMQLRVGPEFGCVNHCEPINIARKIKPDDFTRVNNDVNGNPRYVLHFLKLATDAELDTTQPVSYATVTKRANHAGGRKFHNKQYGGGLVFQCYSLPDLCEFLNKLREVG